MNSNLITLLVALIALGGVVWTNIAAEKRAKRDREDSRHREFVLWQRETLLRLGTEAIALAGDANDSYRKLSRSADELHDEDFTPITEASRKIFASAISLRLLGARDPAERCRQLSIALIEDGFIEATLAVNTTRRKDLSDRKRSEAGTAASNRLDEYIKLVAHAQDDLLEEVETALQALVPLRPPEPHRG